MIVIVLDLSKPGSISDEFLSWINFINEYITPFVIDFKEMETRIKMKDRYDITLQRNQDIINSSKTEDEIVDAEPNL